jgi:hypothetical protein
LSSLVFAATSPSTKRQFEIPFLRAFFFAFAMESALFSMPQTWRAERAKKSVIGPTPISWAIAGSDVEMTVESICSMKRATARIIVTMRFMRDALGVVTA